MSLLYFPFHIFDHLCFLCLLSEYSSIVCCMVEVDIFGKSHVKQNQLAHSTTDFEVVSGILIGIYAYNTLMDAVHFK